MGAAPSPSRWFPALAAGVLSAALAFTLVRPAATDAGAGQRAPPAAVLGDVSLDADLVRGGGRWTVRVRAVNGADAGRRCRVTAEVTELVDSPMSRVARVPRSLWQSELALSMKARGEEERRLAVPAEVARRLDAPPAPRARPEAAPGADVLVEPQVTITHGVHLGGACPAAEPVG